MCGGGDSSLCSKCQAAEAVCQVCKMTSYLLLLCPFIYTECKRKECHVLNGWTMPSVTVRKWADLVLPQNNIVQSVVSVVARAITGKISVIGLVLYVGWIGAQDAKKLKGVSKTSTPMGARIVIETTLEELCAKLGKQNLM
ncbi:hypothetical protein BVC80_1471g12 [Macleaya cordata]|uniref:Uncharacterized protein n=1 Tax=Macleaya cordata TaxID=56857 RepID=A0A200PS38_MACCD|nr:hypothetical protein BVC80_1471g12 [Macleaya cordata]